jgi:putative addiction module killer protein
MCVIIYIQRVRAIESKVYSKWLKKLNDVKAKALINIRVERLKQGNHGNHRFLGDISELRIDFGPGYRIYYKDTGREILILLCGGDKSTQEEDIEKARKIAKLYEGET